MKRTAASILTLLCATAIITAEGNKHRETFTDANGNLTADSIYRIMPFSTEAGNASLFDCVIPCSPQAASLARYAEYPVSHTTGIPDITIPLYEVRR